MRMRRSRGIRDGRRDLFKCNDYTVDLEFGFFIKSGIVGLSVHDRYDYTFILTWHLKSNKKNTVSWINIPPKEPNQLPILRPPLA